MNLTEWMHEVHDLAVQKGWWDEPRSFGDLVSLVHSELSEALEEYRAGSPVDLTYYSGGTTGRLDDQKGRRFKPEGVPSELADVIIRVLDMCGEHGIDIEAALRDKHEFNKTRSHRHGGKVL